MDATYARQSIDKKDSLSIEAQLEKCAALASPGFREYKDKGYSGKSLDRPDFQRMMEDVRCGLIKRIICYRLDRISRNLADFSCLLLELQKYGCEFVSVSENFDTSSPMGRAMVYICMVFAQMERESIAERVEDNYYYRTGLGFWGGGPAPYGYRLAKVQKNGQTHTVLKPDEKEAEVVRKVYAWYLEPGTGIREILTRLNRTYRIRTRKGAEWTSRVLTDLLQRPLYAPNSIEIYRYLKSIGANVKIEPEAFDGCYSVDLYGYATTKGSKHKRCRRPEDMYCSISLHPAIIDSETWIKVQRKRVMNRTQPPRKGTGRNSCFTGLMTCAHCGRGVSTLKSGNGKLSYYVCSARKNLGRDSCELPLLRQEDADKTIISEILAHLKDPEVQKRIREGADQKRPLSPKANLKRNSLLTEIESLQGKIDNLIDALAEGSTAAGKYLNEKIDELDRRKTALELELYELDQEETGISHLQDNIKYLAGSLEHIDEIFAHGSFDEIRSLAKALIQKIIFDKNGTIEIQYFL